MHWHTVTIEGRERDNQWWAIWCKVVYTNYPNQCLPLGARLLSKGGKLLHQVWISLIIQCNMQSRLGTNLTS